MDAFTNGVRPGGLSGSREIKILICYMLMGVSEPLSRDNVRDILVSNEIANMFEVVDAIEDLVQQGSICETEDKLISITEQGKNAASQLVEVIPFSLRDRAIKAALQLTARSRFEKSTNVQIEEVDGTYQVTCSLDKETPPLMSFSIRTADKIQAETIKNQFLNNPARFYELLTALATGDVTEENGIVQFHTF